MTETPSPVDRLVFRAAMRLVRTTPGATTLDDVTRVREQSLVALLAAESGIPAAQVREAIERNPTDYVSEETGS